MIKEYAIDPEFAGDFKNLRLISALFDFSNPRRISRFPNKWERMVYEAADQLGDMNKKKVEVQLSQIKNNKKCLCKFGREYNAEDTWSNNALTSNRKKSYAGILSNFTSPGFINEDNFGDAHPQITASNTKQVTKSLENYKSLFDEVIALAKYVYIVDPYFSHYEVKSLSLFKHWFHILNTRTDAASLKFSLCTSAARNNGPYNMGDEATLIQNSKTRFLNGVSNFNFSARLIPHQDDMHARYIFTDIAAFFLDHSFSVDNSVTMNVSMMNCTDAESALRRFFSTP